jgi:hypothetical protein
MTNAITAWNNEDYSAFGASVGTSLNKVYYPYAAEI